VSWSFQTVLVDFGDSSAVRGFKGEYLRSFRGSNYDQRLAPSWCTMASFWFGSPVDVDIRLEGEETRKQVEVKVDKDRKESNAIYYDGESLMGQVYDLSTHNAAYSCSL